MHSQASGTFVATSLCSSQTRILISIYVSAAHFFRGAATGSSAHLQSAGSAELVPCTLIAAAAAPWDVARECPAGAATPHISDVMSFAVLRISRRLPACTLAPDAPPLGANVTALGYGLLPAGVSSTPAHSRALAWACIVTCDRRQMQHPAVQRNHFECSVRRQRAG